MTRKQYELAHTLLAIIEVQYSRMKKNDSNNPTIKEYENAKEILDFPIGAEEFSAAALKAGYSNSTINDIYKMGKHCCKLIDTINGFVMFQWECFLKRGDLCMTIEDVHNVNDFAEYIIDRHYSEEDWQLNNGYKSLMCKVERKINELWKNKDNDDSDDWVRFDEEYGNITLYRVLPEDGRGNVKERVEDGNIGMSWVLRVEDLDNVPWYEEGESNVVKVTVPVKDKTFIAFINCLDRIIEVVLPNACDKYKVETFMAA